jgi:membrane protease YdiL (CAAX protease family)
LSDGEAPGVPVPATPGGRPRVRWGIGDAIAAWFAGLVVAQVVLGFGVDPDLPGDLVVVLVAQDVAIIGWLVGVARRKGLGTLSADFGFSALPRDGGLATDVGWLLAGVGLQLASLLPISLLVAVHGEDAEQNVVNVADRASGLQVPLIVLAVAVLAPVTEELLFRGALLRGLQRRMKPDAAVFVCALVFGLVHLLGDPSIGSLIAFPAILLLGLVAGYQAVRTGDLSRSIMLHIGFNSLSAVLLFA